LQLKGFSQMICFRRAENERLRGTLKNKEQDLAAAKSALERLTAAVSHRADIMSSLIAISSCPLIAN
jgi:hypothetical protein